MIDKNNIPQHIAIIMDGNGRWAKERGQVRTAGHVEGVAALQRITADCCRLGVKYLTLYAFSTENWNRPDDEVAALMGLVLTHLTEELFDKNHVRMRVIGDRSRLPQAVREKLECPGDGMKFLFTISDMRQGSVVLLGCTELGVVHLLRIERIDEVGHHGIDLEQVAFDVSSHHDVGHTLGDKLHHSRIGLKRRLDPRHIVVACTAFAHHLHPSGQ